MLHLPSFAPANAALSHPQSRIRSGELQQGEPSELSEITIERAPSPVPSLFVHGQPVQTTSSGGQDTFLPPGHGQPAAGTSSIGKDAFVASEPSGKNSDLRSKYPVLYEGFQEEISNPSYHQGSTMRKSHSASALSETALSELDGSVSQRGLLKKQLSRRLASFSPSFRFPKSPSISIHNQVKKEVEQQLRFFTRSDAPIWACSVAATAASPWAITNKFAKAGMFLATGITFVRAGWDLYKHRKLAKQDAAAGNQTPNGNGSSTERKS